VFRALLPCGQCRWMPAFWQYIYNGKATDIDNILSEFNNMSPKLNLTSELEENKKINFLDFTITK